LQVITVFWPGTIRSAADMIHIRYHTYLHVLRFQNQEFGQRECFGFIHTVNPSHTSAKQNYHMCSVYLSIHLVLMLVQHN